jgi:hypothetical protein
MSKLTLNALKERVETVATDELLLSISGGTENSCHDEPQSSACTQCQRDYVLTQGSHTPLGTWLLHLIFH